MSEQKCALHRFSKHGYKHAVKRFVVGTHCLMCLTEFHTRERLLNHLKVRPNRHNVCRLNYLDSEPVHDVESLGTHVRVLCMQAYAARMAGSTCVGRAWGA